MLYHDDNIFNFGLLCSMVVFLDIIALINYMFNADISASSRLEADAGGFLVSNSSLFCIDFIILYVDYFLNSAKYFNLYLYLEQLW
jgi:hypothetical protein